MTRHRFEFAPAYQLPALVLGITPRTAWAEISDTALSVRFGLWRLETGLSNVREVSLSGGYTWLKTAGPPHLSFADRGVTFATNPDRGVCVLFHEPVAGIDPTGHLKHPGATLTVAEPDDFADRLRRHAGIG